MDQFDIYVNIERPSGKPGKKKSLEKCSENIYQNGGHTLEPIKSEVELSGAEGGKKANKSPCKAAAVFLGLLCLLLLIGLITLVFLFVKNNSAHEKEKILLQISYNNLKKERDQLHTYINETQERYQTNYSQLQERVETVIKDRNDLWTKFEEGWVYFRGGFYQISSTKENWKRSRDDCLQKGADLLIIDNKEKQDFANQFEKSMWIGLTDDESEGTWKWVDGTPLTQSYWSSEEPNGGNRENCGNVKNYEFQSSWNDEDCTTSLFWICEKK